MATEEGVSTQKLPDCIIENIFVRLPVKPLVRFKCVSKGWHNLLTGNANFIKKHLKHAKEKESSNGFMLRRLADPVLQNHSYFITGTLDVAARHDYPAELELRFSEMDMVASTNGLVCLYEDKDTCHESTVFLWNPANKEHKVLPLSHENRLSEQYEIITLGFGFHHETDDYKVVKIVSFDGVGSEVEVYSLRSNSWGSVGTIPFTQFDDFSTATVNGCMHWMTNKMGADLIISFDMAEEVFKEILLPDYLIDADDVIVREFEGSLCLLNLTSDRNASNIIDVWRMGEYGVNDSWTQVFKTEIPGGLVRRILELSKDGKVFLERFTGELIVYHPATQMFNIIHQGDHIDNEEDVELTTYVQSLVSCNIYNEYLIKGFYL